MNSTPDPIDTPHEDAVRPRRKGIYILPNLFTLAALFGGFYAIVMAMNLRFDLAAIGVFAAMILGHWYLVTPKLPEAPLVLLARLHLEGFFWGDFSLSNALFRRDAGEFLAYLVDAETCEQHAGLGEPMRAHDSACNRNRKTAGAKMNSVEIQRRRHVNTIIEDQRNSTISRHRVHLLRQWQEFSGRKIALAQLDCRHTGIHRFTKRALQRTPVNQRPIRDQE